MCRSSKPLTLLALAIVFAEACDTTTTSFSRDFTNVAYVSIFSDVNLAVDVVEVERLTIFLNYFVYG